MGDFCTLVLGPRYKRIIIPAQRGLDLDDDFARRAADPLPLIAGIRLAAVLVVEALGQLCVDV